MPVSATLVWHRGYMVSVLSALWKRESQFCSFCSPFRSSRIDGGDDLLGFLICDPARPAAVLEESLS